MIDQTFAVHIQTVITPLPQLKSIYAHTWWAEKVEHQSFAQLRHESASYTVFWNI